MNKLSKEKRDKLVLTSLAIAAVLGTLYTFVLGAQKETLARVEQQILSTKDKLNKAERLVRSAPIIEVQLGKSRELLEAKQAGMAPQGQYYYWFLQLVDNYRKKENLKPDFIVDLTQPEFIEAGLLPKFPFKAASFGVRLNGRFQDIGRFVADLENCFPYFRVQNIRMSPQGTALGAPFAGQNGKGATSDSDEKLMVEIRVVTLIKPGNT
jgi:hypothetical protein